MTLFLNLLIAQLVSANERINSQKVGLARLSRMEIIIETLRTVTKKRLERFVDTRCSWTRICEAAAEQPHLWQATLGVAVACLPASTIQHLTELYRDELCRMLASRGVPFHVVIVKTLTENAPVLHPVLSDGLIWRSRLNQDGAGWVNYNIKPLLLTQDGKFAATVKNLCDDADPGLVCHPVNLVVFSKRVSLFVLVCGRMLREVSRIIRALFGAIETTASSASVLHHGIQDLLSIADGFLTLLEISLGKNSGLKYQQHHYEPLSSSPTPFSCSAL